jgi:hypothetical protein
VTRRDHPYRAYPARSYWSRSVARQFDPAGVVTVDGPVLRRGDRVASMGSCFASNLVPHIERAGFEYVRTEPPHPAFAALPENFGYRDFSAAYGNLYTARQMVQLVERSLGRFVPREDRWYEDVVVVDALRPGLAYPASSDVEFDAITRRHLDATREVFVVADVVILTLGLTEGWVSTIDGAVFPACPGTVAGTFDADRHVFHNFTIDEVVEDLHALAALVRELKPSIRFVVTVSPVPLVATASGRHVLEATVYSKSVLRAAAAEFERSEDDVQYFPAYELVTGPQAPSTFFEDDRRSVSAAAIETVMNALLAVCEVTYQEQVQDRPEPIVPAGRQVSDLAALSRELVKAECEEEFLEVGV